VLDVRLIRDQPDVVRRGLATKGGADLIPELIELDAERRRLVRESEDLKALRNKASEAIGQAKRRGEDASAEQARMREVGERIKTLDAELKSVDERLEALALQLPNLPHPSVPEGKNEDDNVEVRHWSEPRTFAFPPKPHEEVGAALGLDMERAARIAKARFAVLWGGMARLERALAQLMLDLHTREHGYTEIWVPHLVNGETMLKTGQLPKFEEQLFKTVEADEGRPLYLIPTSEVALTALHAGDMKGIYRQHQFDKVELVKLATPARAYEELESMVANAETVLKRLEIPFRVVERCTGDLGFSAAKGYDIEVWLPGQGRYREISSCSNYDAFGGRRADIRFRPDGGGRPEYCATLNGSGLAVGRTVMAVIENYQEADGSVTIPQALRPYMHGLTRLTPR